MNIFIKFSLLALFTVVSCGSAPEANQQTASLADDFGQYWYQGKAELTSYVLEQARYGEIHQGHAVLVFVTEPFSKRKQVKLDYAQQAGNDAVSVLKLNMTKKFNTGVYPYSMMSSVFTPIERNQYPNTLKVTTSVQEWCGHTFTQLNLKEKKYDVLLRSYFESEGDVETTLDKALLEDEVWSLIRLNPNALPTGKVKLIPGSMYQRLKHTDFKVETAEASLKDHATNSALRTYTMRYPNHTLAIHFNRAFPHEIEGWEEEMTSGFGSNARTLVTRATKNKSLLLDYWSKNGVADARYRQALGLPQ